jgi:membrane-associated protease RseP (regulator of RpoE activity)
MSEGTADESAPAAPNYATHLALFAATFASMMYVGAGPEAGSSMLRGWKFAVPLLLILAVHELGHFVFAKVHRVDASLPYFLPFPLSMLGTLGAVIAMRGPPRSRNALLDVGASGPIAGMLVAIPVLVVGLRLSHVEPVALHGSGSLDEGQSLFYLAMKWVVLGPIPNGYDVALHPTAFAGWAGLLMTMLNLIPVGQLDGGHVAYALLGNKADRLSVWVRRALLAIGAAVATYCVAHARSLGDGWPDSLGASESALIWPIYWLLLGVLTRSDRPDGVAAQSAIERGLRVLHHTLLGPREAHPPTDDETLSRGRRVVAWCTLLLFVLLFMPLPMAKH